MANEHYDVFLSINDEGGESMVGVSVNKTERDRIVSEFSEMGETVRWEVADDVDGSGESDDVTGFAEYCQSEED